jgi:uncharacterized protein (TIGR02246 family)
MRYRILFCVFLLTAGLFYSLALADKPPATSAATNDQGIRKAVVSYTEAFNKGSVDGILAYWTADAEYIDELGQSTKGGDALAALFKKAFSENLGVKIQIQTTAIRFVNADVAMHEGAATLTQSNGESNSNPFTAIWVRKDGNWLLNLVRELPAPDAVTKDGPTSGLKNLAWLVGEWSHEDPELKTTIVAGWMTGQRFLKLEYSVRKKNDEVLALTQIVGWDPTTERLRSWVFDSRGGFGEGSWSRDGQTWTVDIAGVTANGLHGSGTNKWTFVDERTFVFHALDRNLDGQPLPDIKITYQRAKKSK